MERIAFIEHKAVGKTSVLVSHNQVIGSLRVAHHRFVVGRGVDDAVRIDFSNIIIIYSMHRGFAHINFINALCQLVLQYRVVVVIAFFTVINGFESVKIGAFAAHPRSSEHDAAVQIVIFAVADIDSADRW